MVVPDTHLNNAIMIVNRIREQVAAIVASVEKQTISTSITLGVSCYGIGESIGDAIARADAAFYKGKNRAETASCQRHR
jgi:diguanylate cyclase (GGDEF)-like protein